MSIAQTFRQTVARIWTPLVLCALVAVVAGLGAAGPSDLSDTTVTMLVNVILVTGLYMFVGNSGVFSFGHIAFAAVGAYCAAILAMEPKTKKVEYPYMWAHLQTIHVPDQIDVVAGGL